MSAMQQPRKDLLRDTLVAAADTIIAERRRASGWEKFANDTLGQLAEVRRVEFRSGLAGGFFVGVVLTVAAWWLSPYVCVLLLAVVS